MWWSDAIRARLPALRRSAVALGGLRSRASFTRCMAATAAQLQAELQSIAVDPIPDQLGHYLGDALQTDLNGTGARVAPNYHLVVMPSERVQSAAHRHGDQRAQAASVITDTRLLLTPVGARQPIAHRHRDLGGRLRPLRAALRRYPRRARCRNPGRAYRGGADQPADRGQLAPAAP